MDKLSKEILETVKEYNERGEQIYLQRLVEIYEGRESKSKLQKRVRWLTDDGKLVIVRERSMQKRGICDSLHIPPENGQGADIRDLVAETKNDVKMLLAFFGITSEVYEGIRKLRRH